MGFILDLTETLKTPGQEKYESCNIVEKEGSKMIIKCPFLYYFLTKI